jgi:PKD repeat protein
MFRFPTRRTRRPATRFSARLGVATAALLVVAAAFPAAGLADPPAGTPGVEVSAAVRHDVSPPLAHLGPTAPSAANLRERPLRLVGPGSGPNQPDGAVQAAPSAEVATTGGLNFAGVGAGDYGFTDQYAPPDTNGAVGATQYVQWVNTYLAVFNKSTGAIADGFPKAGNAVWSGFGGGCEANNDGDPIVQYDKLANRWILTQFSVSSTPYLQCVAISTSSDATGSYYRYAFSYGSSQFPDYPKLGVWPDAYYITFNMFTNTFIGPKACAYDRAAMLAGHSATQQCFQLSSSYGAMLPGDLDGMTPPPTGEPNPLLAMATNSLNFWRFHVDWVNSGNTTLTGPINIPVASFSPACNGSNCVPQPGTSQKLDSLGDRLMYRLAYRNFGDHESLVVNHSVSVGGRLFRPGTSSVRWYEIRKASSAQNLGQGTPVVYQQGTLDTSDGIHRWMGSIAMDQSGDIALGYSASSSSVYPSIRYTGRTPSDALGTMEAENIIKAGTGSQLQNLSRWGDYSAMTVDPVDDCTFWYTNEYLKTNGTWNWSTQIASFKFPGCGTTNPTAPVASFTASPTSGPAPLTVLFTDTSTGGATGWSWDFGDTATSAAQNPSHTYASPGTYTVTLTASNTAGSSQATGTINVTSPPTATVPDAPQNLSATDGPGKGVSLTWSTPANDGGSAILGYYVYRSDTSSLGDASLVASLGTVTKDKDTTTTKGQTYFYWVSAYNVVGESAPPAGPVSASPSK